MPIETERWTTLPAEGSFSSRFCSPTRNSCLIPVECFAFWFSSCWEVGHAAERLVDLVDRARNREPQQQPDRSDHSEVVQRNSQRARDAVLGEPVDARAHRGREDEAEEDEREHDLQLPERERERDHGHGDDGRDEGFAGGVGHSRRFSPCVEQAANAGVTPQSGEAGRAMLASDEQVCFDARRHGVVARAPARAGGASLPPPAPSCWRMPWPPLAVPGRGARRGRGCGLPARGLALGAHARSW